MIAIAGGKGGSGKTTTALGLASALVSMGREPLVVDCDCDMPNAHHLADVDSTGGVDDVADGATLEGAMAHSTAVPGVRILTAGSRERIASALSRVQQWHGDVLLDCPPGIGPDAARPLRHAAGCLLVTTDQPQSIEDTLTTARTARELDAEPLAVLIRTSETNSSAAWPETEYLQARTKSVSAPFEHPSVRTVWTNIAHSLTEPGRIKRRF